MEFNSQEAKSSSNSNDTQLWWRETRHRFEQSQNLVRAQPDFFFSIFFFENVFEFLTLKQSLYMLGKGLREKVAISNNQLRRFACRKTKSFKGNPLILPDLRVPAATKSKLY